MSVDTGTPPVGLFTGQHVLAELEGVSPELLDDEQFLRRWRNREPPCAT